ncbi:MAG TPA: hypothetical protein VGJ57_12675 [Nitrospirales bacterium]|jgi:hypothetical protein
MASSDADKRARLILYDAFTAPRRPVIITADLLQKRFLRNVGLGGELVVFQHQGRSIGQAMTGGDGRAVKHFVPTAVGSTPVSARLADNRRVAAEAAAAHLFVWPRSRSLILISLHALTRHVRKIVPGSLFSDADAALPDPEPEAVKMLSAVARRHELIYLILADPLQLPGILQWVAEHRMPAAPVVLMRGDQGLADECDRLRREGWSGVKGGIPSTPAEAKIFLDRGTRAVAPPFQEKWPAKTDQTKSWDEVTKRLLSA